MQNEDHDIYLKSGMSESGYIETNETQIFYYRDPILAVKDVNISFQLHVMTGKARLRAKVCPVEINEKYEDFKDRCTYTTEEMLEVDPNEFQAQHLGSEADKTDTDICKIPSEEK